MDKKNLLGLSIILLRMVQVEAATGLKKSAIYQKIKEGTFPPAVKLSRTHRAWRSDHIEEWIASRPQVVISQPSEKVA